MRILLAAAAALLCAGCNSGVAPSKLRLETVKVTDTSLMFDVTSREAGVSLGGFDWSRWSGDIDVKVSHAPAGNPRTTVELPLRSSDDRVYLVGDGEKQLVWERTARK